MTWLFLLLCFLSLVSATIDFYKVLGVPRDASLIQIKRAYKKLSKELHPDKADNPEEVREKYLQVQSAYELLRDNERRQQYDETGSDGTSDEDKQWDYQRARMLFSDENDVLEFQSEEEWEEVLYGDDPVIVFFWAQDPPAPAVKAGNEYKKFATRWRGLLPCYQLSCDYFRRVCSNNGGFNSPSLAMVGRHTIRWHRGRMLDYAMSDLAYRVMRSWLAPAVKIREFGPDSFPVLSCYHLVIFQKRTCDECLGEVYAAWGRLTAHFLRKSLPGNSGFPKLKLAMVQCEDYPEFCSEWGLEAGGSGGANVEIAAVCPNDPSSIPPETSDTMIPEQLRLKWQTQQNQQVAWLRANHQEGVLMHNDIMVFMWQQFMPLVTAVIDESHFNQMVLQDEDAFLVTLLPPLSQCATCQDALVDLDTVARMLKNYYNERYQGVIKMARVDCSYMVNFCSTFDFDWSNPKVIIYPFTVAAKQHPQVYDGQFNIENIASAAQKESEPVSIIQLTRANGHMIDDGNWLVLFSAGSWCPPCTAMKAVYKDASRVMDGTANPKKPRVAQVDCDREKVLCNSHGIEGYPTIQTLVRKGGRPGTYEFEGNREADEIASWAIDSIDNMVNTYGRDLVQKTSGNEALFVMFSAGNWCPPCMRAKAFWPQVARALDGIFEVGQINCDQWGRLCGNFGIQAYPTFVLYTFDKKAKRKTLVYDGNAWVDGLVEFAKNNAPKNKKRLGN